MNALVNIWCEAIQVSPLHSAYQLDADTQVLYLASDVFQTSFKCTQMGACV